MELLRDGLDALLAGVKSVQSDWRKKFNALEFRVTVGVEDLPDDVLSIIFELAYYEGNASTPEKLSSVSHRFRTLALQMPHLWTNIASWRHNVEAMSILAKRSSSRPLFVSLHCQSYRTRKDKEEEAQKTTISVRLFNIASSPEPLAAIRVVTGRNSGEKRV